MMAYWVPPRLPWQVRDAERVVLSGCAWDAMVEGNGVLFDRYTESCALTRSTLRDVGGTPVLIAGATNLFDGRAGTQPRRTEVSHNHMHHFGVWGRQAAGVFEGLACASNISFNVVHDMPRAAINFNDDFCGGTRLEANLLFNAVLDTGEHGTVNSWGRQPLLYTDEATGEPALAGAPRQVVRNLVVRTSYRGQSSNLWALDKDDGSSRYLEAGNVLLFGAIKDRDGLERNASGNLLLLPDAALFAGTATHGALTVQVSGFEWDRFTNNTVVLLPNTTSAFVECTTGITPTAHHAAPAAAKPPPHPTYLSNTYVTPGGSLAPSAPFPMHKCAKAGTTFAEWQKAGFDRGSTLSNEVFSAEQLVGLSRRWLEPVWPRES